MNLSSVDFLISVACQYQGDVTAKEKHNATLAELRNTGALAGSTTVAASTLAVGTVCKPCQPSSKQHGVWPREIAVLLTDWRPSRRVEGHLLLKVSHSMQMAASWPCGAYTGLAALPAFRAPQVAAAGRDKTAVTKVAARSG